MRADLLHVVTAITNPARFRSRYALYRDFAKRVADAGAVLWTVEAAFGDRPHAVTEASNPRHVQLRTPHEVWLKECLLNIGIGRLPPEAEYIAWVDADVAFARPDWAEETVHQLQHYDVVQLFSAAHDLGPDLVPFATHWGFCHEYRRNAAGRATAPGAYARFWHPGFAWAARRSAIDAVGGLLDTAIAGAADHHMALGLIGRAEESLPANISPGYRAEVLRWQARAERHVRRNIGYVPGLLLHYWHGSKSARQYVRRWDILTASGFDPAVDLKRDSQGLWQLTDRSTALRDGMRDYFRNRDEDGTSLIPP